MGAELRHLLLYEFLFLFGDAELNAYWSCSVCHKKHSLQFTTDIIQPIGGVIPTDFLFFLAPYNGHFFSVCPPVREDFNKKRALGFSGNESALEIRV